MITTPDSFADESASVFYAQLTAFQAKVFDNEADAQAWLRQQARATPGASLPSPAQS